MRVSMSKYIISMVDDGYDVLRYDESECAFVFFCHTKDHEEAADIKAALVGPKDQLHGGELRRASDVPADGTWEVLSAPYGTIITWSRYTRSHALARQPLSVMVIVRPLVA